MKTWQKRLGISLIVFVLVTIIFTSLIGDYMIKEFINTGGPRLLGVPVHLESVTFRPILGYVTLKGLHIGNPEGFKSDSLFNIARLDLRVRTLSLLSNKVIINRIIISGTELTYERRLTTSNIDSLLSRLAPAPATGEAAKPATPAQKSPSTKKVIMKDLIIDGTRVHVAFTALGGHGFTLPLPPIHLSNVGGTEDGASFREAMHEIMSAIVLSVGNAVASSGKAISSGASAVGEGAGKAAEGIKNLFK